MQGGALDLMHNVRITVFDQQHNIKQVIEKHNRANQTLVTGIIKFLRGEFNPTNISNNIFTHNVNGAKAYIPAYISFGDSQIKQINGTTVKTKEQASVNIGNIAQPNFYETSLQHELVNTQVPRVQLSRSQYGLGTHDNVMLSLTTYVPAGLYPKIFNSKTSGTTTTVNSMVFSELGLFSSEYDGLTNGYKGKMLARVVFDKDTCILQDKNDVILVEWQISIASIVPSDDIEENAINTIWEVEGE